MEEEKIDFTDELVIPVECCEEEANVRELTELMHLDINEMSEAEVRYVINALKIKNDEYNKIIESQYNRYRKLNEARDKDLKLMEDTLTFIKTEITQCLGAVSLAIKNMEREVMKHGN